jgi:hypothetical protein
MILPPNGWHPACWSCIIIDIRQFKYAKPNRTWSRYSNKKMW